MNLPLISGKNLRQFVLHNLCQCGFFEVEQEGFFVGACGVAGEGTVAAEHPVAGDYQGYGVVSHRIAHSLCRHPFQTVLAGDGTCYLAVGDGVAVWDFEQQLPHMFAKVAALHPQIRGEIGDSATEIAVEPEEGLAENGQVGIFGSVGGKRRGEIFLTLEPKSCKCLSVGGEDDTAKRRLVAGGEIHRG